ncbi:hypothetical protein Leryth_012569 [Lithospermum erythrorhizon]|nr:hypothetical protein Leryth_012569 [Lithospermum erythrorhizon]
MMLNTKSAIFRALHHHKTSLERVISTNYAVIKTFSTTQHPRILTGTHYLSKKIGIFENASRIHKDGIFFGFAKMGFVQIRELSEKSGCGLEERIKKIISDNPVVVYSKTYCPLDVEAQVIELDQLGDEGLEMLKVLKRLTDQHTVPNVFIETLKLYKEGELEDLLAEAEA